MSVLNKKPYITDLLSQCSLDELKELDRLVNGGESEILNGTKDKEYKLWLNSHFDNDARTITLPKEETSAGMKFPHLFAALPTSAQSHIPVIPALYRSAEYEYQDESESYPNIPSYSKKRWHTEEAIYHYHFYVQFKSDYSLGFGNAGTSPNPSGASTLTPLTADLVIGPVPEESWEAVLAGLISDLQAVRPAPTETYKDNFRSFVNPDYFITTEDKGIYKIDLEVSLIKAQNVYTGYFVYPEEVEDERVKCALIYFTGNKNQNIGIIDIDVAEQTYQVLNVPCNILELRSEIADVLSSKGGGVVIQADDVDSGSATAGKVLTADGEGGASWEDASGGVYHVMMTDLTSPDGTHYYMSSEGVVAAIQAGNILVMDHTIMDAMGYGDVDVTCYINMASSDGDAVVYTCDAAILNALPVAVQVEGSLVLVNSGSSGYLMVIGKSLAVENLLAMDHVAIQETHVFANNPLETNIYLPSDVSGFTETLPVQTAIAPEYSASNTYNQGDICMNFGFLWVCTTNNTTGTWDSTKWNKTSVAEYILGMINGGY